VKKDLINFYWVFISNRIKAEERVLMASGHVFDVIIKTFFYKMVQKNNSQI